MTTRVTPAQLHAIDRMNNLTAEEVARAMEKLPTDVLEFAVKFEGLANVEVDECRK